MSAYVYDDFLPKLWDDILKMHWNYLEMEENVQKLEERKKLENCLKEFLCIAPCDRRFFLPETNLVLEKTVRELHNFTANKAAVGFESIFQYASNLFTKPWRKEYRIIKMYSGFFEHEVLSNLVDAIKLFEAMGYRQLSDNILVLDGPICPDQMTSVTADAIAAYVECQIMKQIYLGLQAMNLECTWQDVYQFRQQHVGGITHAIKNLAHAISERTFRKDKNSSSDNFYSSIPHSSAHYQNYSSYPHTHAHAHAHKQSQLKGIYAPAHNGHCAVRPPPLSPMPCSVHTNPNNNNAYYNSNNVNSKLIASYPAANDTYMNPHHHYTHVVAPHPHMSHSRSLEQYSEPPQLLPHRHSFDHQPQGCMATHHYQQPNCSGEMHVYESPYDCGDSTGSNASYAMVASSAYNVSGNRYPLPHSISSQLNTDYATPATVTCNGIKCNDADNLYASVSKTNVCSLHPHNAQNQSVAAAHMAAKDFHNNRQRSFPPDQHLIDFDDRAPLATHDFHAQFHALTQNNSFDAAYEQTSRQAKRTANRLSSHYVQPRDSVCSHAKTPTPTPTISGQLMAAAGNDNSENYGYARPIPRSSRSRTSLSSKNVQDSLESCMSREKENVVRHGSTHLLNPFDDFVYVGNREKVRVSPTQAVKNQDGVGSFETWDYVYQNLERSGYTKDHGDRADLAQNLDIQSLQIGTNNGSTTSATSATTSGAEAVVEKRRGTELKAGRQNLDKLRNLEKSAKTAEERHAQNVPTTNGLAKKTPTKKSTSTSAGAMYSAVAQNNNNDIITAGKDVRRVPELSKPSPRSIQKVNTPSVAGPVNSEKQWNCRVCTYLNPNAQLICEMCFKSKDFCLESAASHARTCV